MIEAYIGITFSLEYLHVECPKCEYTYLRTLLGTLMSPSKCNLIFFSELPSLKK